MSYEVIHGNALALPLEDETVDLIITSPPYFALRSYRDGDEHYEGQVGSEPTPQEFLEALWAATREMVRVLKPSGSIFVNLGDKYAGSGGHNNAGVSRNGTSGSTLTGGKKKLESLHHSDDDIKAERRNAPDRYNQNSGGIPAKSLMGLPWRYAIGCIDQLGLILRAEVIWSKPNGLPESVTDRVRRSHETWFHMVKSPRYFSAVDEVREAYQVPDHAQIGKENRSHRDDDAALGVKPWHMAVRTVNPLGKLPGSVWTIPSEPLIIPDAVKQAKNLPDHFAAFPQEFPRRIILGWSPTGICSHCGFLLGSSYDKGLLGVRDADHRGASPRRLAAEPVLAQAKVLQSDVFESACLSQPSDHEVPPPDDAGIRGSLEAGSPDGAEERVPDGTPARDGRALGPRAAPIGSGAPHQRSEDGQPDRESGTAGEDRARPEAEAPPEAVPLPTLRWAASDLRDAQSCPHCGGTSFRAPVVADVFGGTGTVAGVAHALGRHGISVDLSQDYCRLAEWRINESGHFQKAWERSATEGAAVPATSPQDTLEGRLSLFDEAS